MPVAEPSVCHASRARCSPADLRPQRGSRAPRRRSAALIRTLCALVLTGSVLGCLPGCQKAAPAPQPPQPVLAAQVVLATEDHLGSYSGSVRGHLETTLAFRIAGQLRSRSASLGQHVREGQILAELDPADVRASRAQAEAAVRASEERLALAHTTNERNLRQAKADLISQADLDQSQSNLAVAEAELAESRAQLALTDNQQHYTGLHAPGNGVVTSELAEVGSVLSSGQGVFGFTFDGERDVVIDLPEDGIAGIVPGTRAEVTLYGHPDQVYLAHVREIAAQADAQSRTFRAKLALEHPDAGVVLGTTADVRFVAGAVPGQAATDNASSAQSRLRLRIPASALFHSGNEPAVWLIRPTDHQLELRPVRVAGYGESDVEIESGLAEGDLVVASGVHTVTQGEVVNPTPLAPRRAAP